MSFLTEGSAKHGFLSETGRGVTPMWQPSGETAEGRCRGPRLNLLYKFAWRQRLEQGEITVFLSLLLTGGMACRLGDI